MKHIINGFYGRLGRNPENDPEKLLVAKDNEDFKKYHKLNLISGLQFFDDSTLGMYISKSTKFLEKQFMDRTVDGKTNLLLGGLVAGTF